MGRSPSEHQRQDSIERKHATSFHRQDALLGQASADLMDGTSKWPARRPPFRGTLTPDSFHGHDMTQSPLTDLALRLREFAAERDWDRFHTPKNLAMALTGEAGELAAEFLWLTEAQSEARDVERMARVQQEAADVLLYLVRLADKLHFDLLEAAHQKIEH